MLQTPLCRTATFQSSYFNRIVKPWNSVCQDVNPCTFSSPISFKNVLKRRYLELLHSVYNVERFQRENYLNPLWFLNNNYLVFYQLVNYHYFLLQCRVFSFLWVAMSCGQCHPGSFILTFSLAFPHTPSPLEMKESCLLDNNYN